MRVLITGGNGYVGREVTRLLHQHHDVCILDNVRYGKIRLSDEQLSRIRFERADITNQQEVEHVLSDFSPEAIIHLAAIHYIPECEQNPSLTVSTNVIGTINLLRACPSGCRFVHASSGAVYKPSLEPHRESSDIEPSDIYGLSKLQSEQYVRYFARQHGLETVIVRLFNVIGPGETNPHLLPEIVAQLKSGRTTIHLGNIWPKRDYIHVRDAARGFVATALNHIVPPGESTIVNLGTSQPYSVAEVIEKLRIIAEIDFEYEQDSGRMRAVDRPHLAADNHQIRRLFGWQPELTIDQALSDLWLNPDLSDQLIAKYQ
jgi:UDP-glucose 4-epimerase